MSEAVHLRLIQSEAASASHPGFEELLTPLQAAERLGLLADRSEAQAVASIRWLIRTRKLPAVRLNYRCWRIRPIDLNAYLERQRGR